MQEEQFARLVTQMRASLEVRDRVHRRVPYFQCFVGRDLADYLMQQLQLETREEAVLSGQRWMNAGVFYGVTNATHFEDGDALYRFKVALQTQEGGALCDVTREFDLARGCFSGCPVDDGIQKVTRWTSHLLEPPWILRSVFVCSCW